MTLLTLIRPRLHWAPDAAGQWIAPPQWTAARPADPLSALTLRKLYVEPTSLCNIACRTCIRNIWDEPAGRMSAATFARVLEGLVAFTPVPEVFFGGFGEPLFHPQIAQWVTRAKTLGATVELITNGTLLTASLARALIDAGLDRLWVSLDGATPASYADVRLGAALPRVLANLRRFRDLRDGRGPEIGIVFVAMRRNLRDLPALLQLAQELDAARFMISNVLPYTAEMRDEVLYAHALSNNAALHFADQSPAARAARQIALPTIDAQALDPALLRQIAQGWRIVIGRDGAHPALDRCPFIADGTLAVGWDGSTSPCLPLLHSHVSYLHRMPRQSRRYVIGDVNTVPLADLWHDATHISFRRRVLEFDFSPCAYCDGCNLSETNEVDCYGQPFPTCGGCLWAQGVVQCP